MNTLPVTAIIPCHNSSKTIERAVTSAYLAGCDTILCYDDASADNTVDVLIELCAEYSNVDFFRACGDVRAGVNFARNFLIEQAPDGLIIPLDSDDSLRDVETLRNAYADGFWVYGDYVEHYGTDTTYVKGSPAGALPRKEITGVTFLFNREDWQRVGGYDYDFAYAEDFAFQCALVNAGVQPLYVDTIVYDRYIKPEGNERTVLAGEYWSFYRTMARRKYQNVFAKVGG